MYVNQFIKRDKERDIQAEREERPVKCNTVMVVVPGAGSMVYVCKLVKYER